MTPDKLREKGNRWRELGQYDLANIYNQHAVALEEIERLKGELEESRRDLQFVERWANHHGVKPHITAKEVLSMIQHYPPIRAITEGYEDGKIPDTPNPLDRAEQAERRAERLQAKVDSLMLEYCPDEMTPEQLAEWEKHQRAVPAEFKGE